MKEEVKRIGAHMQNRDKIYGIDFFLISLDVYYKSKATEEYKDIINAYK